ncbi:MAG: DUF4350 domain-containing protein [Roseiflexaceae bacterium]
MSARRDILMIMGLFLVLVLFIAFGPTNQPPPSPIAPTTHSTSESGAQALLEWAQRMEYRAERLEYREFRLEPETDALIILSPQQPIEPAEADQVIDWLEQGGTLIVADDTSNLFGANNALLESLQVEIRVISDTSEIERAKPLQPALDQPSVAEISINASRYIAPQRNDHTVLLGTADLPLVIGVQVGSGYAYISSSAYPFTNQGLRDEQNARMILNMLRRVPSGGQILFDEIHHGYIRPPSTTSVVLGSPWGWGGVYAMLVISLFLILSGRRFGAPIPFTEEIQRRSSAEYVESMAALLLRGKKHQFVQRHYHQQLKRRIARSYGLNPMSDDTTFVAELKLLRAIDETRVQSVLAQLRSTQKTEAAFVDAINQADQLLHELQQRQ